MNKTEELTDMDNRFTYHAPDDRQTEYYQQVRSKALGLARFLVKASPECRERSLAITKLEEAVFWANAAVARNGLNK